MLNKISKPIIVKQINLAGGVNESVGYFIITQHFKIINVQILRLEL